MDADAQGLGTHASEISRGMVTLMKQMTGRGPIKARTTIGRDHVLVMLHEVLTHTDRMLVGAGENAMVHATRQKIQELMRPDAKRLVEQTLQREVVGFMSANEFDPDMACEVFVLSPIGADSAAPISEDEVRGDPDDPIA
jgi:uncharacterized protein YbcI